MTRSTAAAFVVLALPLTTTALTTAALTTTALTTAAWAQAAPPQPSLPAPVAETGGPLVDKIMRPAPPTLDVHRRARHASHAGRAVHRHVLAARARLTWPLDRPALAGVALVTPLPPLREPPHIRVPMPAYPVESLAYWFGAPRPDIVCVPAPRDPDLPDPRLYRERPVLCEPDNP